MDFKLFLDNCTQILTLLNIYPEVANIFVVMLIMKEGYSIEIVKYFRILKQCYKGQYMLLDIMTYEDKIKTRFGYK